jgi:hypothetical protein
MPDMILGNSIIPSVFQGTHYISSAAAVIDPAEVQQYVDRAQEITPPLNIANHFHADLNW